MTRHHSFKSDIYGANIVSEMFAAEMVVHNLLYSCHFKYKTEGLSEDLLEKAYIIHKDGLDDKQSMHVIFKHDSNVLEREDQFSFRARAYLSVSTQGFVHFNLAAESEDLLNYWMNWYQENLPKSTPQVDGGKAPINFWYMGRNGPQQTTRKLYVPEWKQIEENYTKTTKEALDKLMHKEFRPETGGQFILWLGQPGTGKTTAIRALTYEWRDWCDVQFVVDPDRFFGDTDYMMSFLTNSEEHDYNFMDDPDQEEEEDSEKNGRWMLLVFEDTGELLTKTAKNDTGQGLSRFLNLVDGLIGQGLKIIALVTTNENYGSLSDAVTRPGRCRAKVDFGSLNAQEIDNWCDKNNIKSPVIREHPPTKIQSYGLTLADLYALKNEQIKNEENKVKLGF